MFDRAIAIDSAGDILGLAVCAGDALLAATELEAHRRHVESLVPQLDRLLRGVGLRPDVIDLVAVAAGPGSFTGLRVGLAAAKGVCVATGAALVLVPSLTARAQSEAVDAPGLIVVAEDARKSRVYTQLFAVRPERRLVPLSEVTDIEPRHLVAHWNALDLSVRITPGRGWTIVGSGAHLAEEAAATRFGAANRVPMIGRDRSTVRAVALLGRAAALDGKGAGEYATPYYVRSGDVGAGKRYPRFDR